MTTAKTPLHIYFKKQEGRIYFSFMEERGSGYSVRFEGKSIDKVSATPIDDHDDNKNI
jgi:hypothetical protein